LHTLPVCGLLIRILPAAPFPRLLDSRQRIRVDATPLASLALAELVQFLLLGARAQMLACSADEVCILFHSHRLLLGDCAALTPSILHIQRQRFLVCPLVCAAPLLRPARLCLRAPRGRPSVRS
jgi:hypothetical protein